MKILHVYKTYLPSSRGGIERVIYDLTDHRGAMRHRVLSVSNDKECRREVVNGVEVLFAPRLFEISSTPFFNPFNKEAKEFFDWADIFHYHYPWPFGDLLQVLTGRNKKYLVTYHSDIVKQKLLKYLYSPLKEFFLRKAEFVVATSANYAESSETLQSLNNVKVIPLGLGVDFSKKQVPNIPRRPYFFFIGVHRYYKGLKYLVEAAAGLDCDVFIAGEGPETNNLKVLARRLSVDNVFFLGRLSEEDKVHYLSNCLAFVLPSHLRSEAFGVCLLEAMSVGRPLITTNIRSGMAYVNVDGRTGFCVDPASSKGLRSSMLTFLDDPQLANQMGLEARKRFLECFTASSMRDQYAEIYDLIASS